MKKYKTLIRRCVLIVCGLFLGINLYMMNATSIVGNQLPMPFGIGVATVLSGSMEPNISKGDLIVVKEEKQYQINDIIVYNDGGSYVCHRIVDMGDMVITQGDANNIADEPIEYSTIRGKVILHIPMVGSIVNVVKSPIATIVIIALAILLTEKSFQNDVSDKQKEIERIKEEIKKLKEEN